MQESGLDSDQLRLIVRDEFGLGLDIKLRVDCELSAGAEGVFYVLGPELAGRYLGTVSILARVGGGGVEAMLVTSEDVDLGAVGVRLHLFVVALVRVKSDQV